MLFLLGSRLTNFVGILSQGLRIAPPEAPATGYMVVTLSLSTFIMLICLYITCVADLMIEKQSLVMCSLAKGFTLLTWSVKVLNIVLLTRKIPWV